MPTRKSFECECCGESYPEEEEHGDLFDGLCESCESEYVVCNICQERRPEDDSCRHVFWSEGIWYGSGSYEDPPDHLKASLFAVLDKTQLAGELLNAIAAGTFYLWFHGSIIGQTYVDCHADGRNYGHRLTDDLTSEEEERMSDGVGWLTSLYLEETPKANALTVKWIGEYLAPHELVPS
jgi:hypothetical protein